MKKYSLTISKIMIAFIFIETLFFKFSAAQESVDLFTKIAGDDEALMRIGTGILELLAAVLLFIPKKTWLGAGLAIGLMGGAIMSHLTIIGIEHNNDGGLLFGAAILTFIAGWFVLYKVKYQIPIIGKRFL